MNPLKYYSRRKWGARKMGWKCLFAQFQKTMTIIVFAGAKSDLYHVYEAGHFTAFNSSIKAVGGIYRQNSKRARLKFENVRIPKFKEKYKSGWDNKNSWTIYY